MVQNPSKDISESISEDKGNREVSVKADRVKVYFKGKDKKSGTVKAVDGISFHIMKGETFGVVGENGCGRSTPGRAPVRFLKPTEGHIYTGGTGVAGLKRADLKEVRRKIQIISRDPSTCLDPRQIVRQALMEPFGIHGMRGRIDVETRVMKLLNLAGLDLYCLGRHPRELLGGQKQRIDIARALALEPDVIIYNKAVLALGISVQVQVLNLFQDLEEKLGLTYFFTFHNLNMVYQVNGRVGVMYLGNVAETADYDRSYEKCCHPYTEALLSAIPQVDQNVRTRRIHLERKMPSPPALPSDCRFYTCCPEVCDRCRQEVPELKEVAERYLVACYLY